MVKFQVKIWSQPVNQRCKIDDLDLHQSVQIVEFRVIREHVVQIWLISLGIQYYMVVVELC